MKVTIHETPPELFGDEVYRKEIPSQLERKTPLILEILKYLLENEWIEQEEEMTMRLVLDETLINAIKHGNGEDEGKIVSIFMRSTPERWGIMIQDEGEGFTPEDVPDVDDPESLLLERGRGVLLIHEFMDTVWYYDQGSSVWLVKARPTSWSKAQRRMRRLWRRLLGRC